MALSQLLILSLLFCILFFTLCASSNKGDDVHDLLASYNLPKGLLPKNVKSYSISPKDGSFTVQLTHPCYVQFQAQVVYYGEEIKGKLSYGSISDVSGILEKKLFTWVSITEINVDEDDSDSIEFHVAFLTEKLPADLFEDIPTCKNRPPVASILTSSSNLYNKL